jgi:hypothetical protein
LQSQISNLNSRNWWAGARPGAPGLVFTLLLCFLATTGCAAYRFGNQSLYRCDVKTVHVPVFQSDSFRRNLGERLTEAVVKELALKTPYTIVPADRADTVLTGHIVSDTKRVLVLNADSEPRALESNLQVEVNWTNRRGESVTGRTITLPLPDDAFASSATSAFVPEGGQSISTAQQAAIARLATQIVEQMQAGW